MNPDDVTSVKQKIKKVKPKETKKIVSLIAFQPVKPSDNIQHWPHM